MEARTLFELAKDDTIFESCYAISQKDRLAVLRALAEYLHKAAVEGKLDLTISRFGRLKSAQKHTGTFRNPISGEQVVITKPRNTVRFKASKLISQ